MLAEKKIKVSIITVVKNGLPYLIENMESFQLQSYKNKEQIIVYSKSEDEDRSLKFIKEFSQKYKNIKIIFQKKKKIKGKIYDALNLGLKHSSGDIIGMLHSDDIFSNTLVIETIVSESRKAKFDICYGNVLITKKNNLKFIHRKWKSSNFNVNKLKLGWMPPHPSIFITKKLMHIKYKTNYKISSDYEYILNLFQKNYRIKYINIFTTIMRIGGASSKNFFAYLYKNYEDQLILKKFFSFSKIIALLKIIIKIHQLYFNFFDKFSFDKKDKIYNKIINKKINIYKSINDLNKKKYILSGYNLAFNTLVADDVKFLKNDILLWPDGIISKTDIGKNKLSGYKLLNKIKLNYPNKNLYFLGKNNYNNEKYIKNKFNKMKIVFIKLPFLNHINLINFISKIKFLPNSVFLLNLPTPKQEYLGSYLYYKYNNSKILCFGGAIDYNSGNVPIPPKFIEKYFEFFWRLKYDFFRRLLRLSLTICLFIYRKFFNKIKSVK